MKSSFTLSLPQRSKPAASDGRLGVTLFDRVLAVVTGDPSDEGVLAHAANMVRAAKGKLHALYVIQVDRGLPVDAEIGPASAKGEDVLSQTEHLVKLPKSDFEAHLVQARELGPAVVHEAVSREVQAVVLGTSFPRRYGAFSLGEDIPYILEHAPCLVVLRREAPGGVRGRGMRSPGYIRGA